MKNYYYFIYFTWVDDTGKVGDGNQIVFLAEKIDNEITLRDVEEQITSFHECLNVVISNFILLNTVEI